MSKRSEDIQNQQARERLKYAAKKRVDTTMIGALASIEKHLGFLWGHDSDKPLTADQKALADIYEDLRSEILDKGNNQVRILNDEIDQYEVKKLRYSVLILPVKNQ